MIRETSLLAYEEVKPNRKTTHEIILNLLKITIRPPSNSEIAKSLGWPINRVTPRVNELVKLGKLVDAGKRKCTVTGRLVHTWALDDGLSDMDKYGCNLQTGKMK